MSLQVWLPLNGDLHNQGLDPAVFSKTTENIWGLGKIGERALLTSTGTNKIMVNGLKNKQKFSIAFWVKVDATLNFTSWQDIWALEYTNSTGTGPIRLEHTSTAGNCQLIVYKETNVGENTNAYYGIKVVQNKNSWCHITLTKDQDNTKCYINGNLTNTSSNNQYEASLGKLTGNVTIGASTCAAYLNDVRIYDHCLSSKEVEEISKGLILHYPLNQLYDNNIIYDTSGYCNNGTIVGDITTITPSPRYNCATNFNGSSNAIKVNDNNWCAQGMEQMTINVWVKASSWPANTRIFSCTESGGFNTEGGNSGYYRFPVCVYTNANKTSQTYKYSGQEIKISDLSTTDWNMLTFVYDLTGTKTYINGELHHTYSNVSYGIYFNMNTRLFLGCEAGMNSSPLSPYFNGQESDFRIYATALSAQQIKELYTTSMQIDSSGNVFARELVEL